MKILILKTQRDLAAVKKEDFVESENPELLVKAAEKKVFVNPLHARGFFRNEALMRAVADGGSTFAIPLSVLLHARGASRAKLLRELKLFFRVCFRLKAKFVFTNALAKSKFDLKGKREVQALGSSLFALTPLQAKKAFEEGSLGAGQVLSGVRK